MSYSISIDHEKKIIHYQHGGNIIKEDIGKAWEEFLQMEEFTHKKYNLLSDYSQGKFIGDSDDVEDILEILYELRHILKGKKQALIINEAISTALSVMFERKVVQKVGFIVRVFSTREGGILWLTEE